MLISADHECRVLADVQSRLLELGWHFLFVAQHFPVARINPHPLAYTCSSSEQQRCSYCHVLVYDVHVSFLAFLLAHALDLLYSLCT